MSSSANLLRLLEPSVRPAGVPAGTGSLLGPAAAPAPERSFEALLAEKTGAVQSVAQTTPPPALDSSAQISPGTPFAGASSAAEVEPAAAAPLAALSGIDRVENPALRSLLGQHAA